MTSPRDTLLDKALTYFAEHGVRDTSLRTLAAAIGTSQRMLNYHFGSREDLLAAVIKRVVESDTAALEEMFASMSDPFDAGRSNWERTAGHAEAFGPLYFELASHAMHHLPYAEGLAAAMVERAQAAFDVAYATKTDAETARTLARLTVAVGQGLLFDQLLDGDREASDRAVTEFTAMIRARLGA